MNVNETTIPLNTSIPRFVLAPSSIENGYWEDLIQYNLLRFRIPHIESPTLDDVQQMTSWPDHLCYFGYDTKHNRVCCEVMFSGHQGYAALAHFSVHPDYMGKIVPEMAKEIWKRVFELKRKDGTPWVLSLVGPIPECNKLAIRAAKAAGWVEKCIVSNFYICMYAKKKIQNAVLFQLEANNG